MERKIARPLGDGAKERVIAFLGLPTSIKNKKGEVQKSYTMIDTFDNGALFNLADYKYKIHISVSKYNTIDTFLKEQLTEAKRIQGWFNELSEKELYYPIQHYIAYLENEYPQLCKQDIRLKQLLEIEHLKYNAATLPKSIYEYFCSLGYQKDSFGNLLPPLNCKYQFEENGVKYQCFILEQYYELFQIKISKGEITDENGNVLTLKTVSEFLVSYAKGFTKGYKDFINTVSKTELFDNSSKDLAYKVFERVYPSFIEARNGNITATKGDLQNKKLQMYITKELFFETGYEGGEYFKAWELILKSPMLFKGFFDEIVQNTNNQTILQLQENSKLIIDNLKKYHISQYLAKKGLNEVNFFTLINNHSGKDIMPYTIALLNEIDYLSYFFKEFTTTKVEGFKKLGAIFNVSERRIKGNVNIIMNQNSQEDASQYTSYQHKENIQKELKGL